MRPYRKLLWLTPLALLGALAGGAAARPGDDAKPEDKAVIKLPGAASRGVLSGDHFYTVIGSTIMDVDLKQRQAIERASLTECYDYIPTAPFLDVADGKAVVASEKGTSAAPAINVIDLSNGKVLHAVKYKGEVHGLGFAGDNRVFVLGRTAVVVLDVASGETVQTISMSEDEPSRPTRAGPHFVYQKVGKLLYVAGYDPMHVQAVDLEAGKALDVKRGFEICTGLQAVGDKLFVRSLINSYGIYIPQLGCYDVKTKEYHEVMAPDFNDRKVEEAPEDLFDRTTLVGGPDAGVCLIFEGEGLPVRCRRQRRSASLHLAKDDDGRLLGVWNGRAITAGKDGLRLTPLAKATTAKSD